MDKVDHQWIFLLKLLLLSAALSGLIKYVVPWFELPATSVIALLLVISPTLLLAAALAWRYWRSQHQPDKL
jgi:membrane protein YdbS with pleckstrin-like domain